MPTSVHPTVFVIDPDEAIRDGISLLLGSYDLVVKTYPNAEMFLRETMPRDADCILTESELPGISGIELLRHLRARGKQVPVILLTSSLDSGLLQDAQGRGVADIIRKPLINKKLFPSVDAVLNKHRCRAV